MIQDWCLRFGWKGWRLHAGEIGSRASALLKLRWARDLVAENADSGVASLRRFEPDQVPRVHLSRCGLRPERRANLSFTRRRRPVGAGTRCREWQNPKPLATQGRVDP